MTTNYVNDGIQTAMMVDSIFRQRRNDDRMAADRDRQHAREDMYDRAWQEDRSREQNIRDQKAELFRNEELIRQLQEQAKPEIGTYAADYLDPVKRNADRGLLDEALGRVRSGKTDESFYLDYINTVYAGQINRGTGGVKKVASKIGRSHDGQGIVVGLDVADEGGGVRREMMTANRGTRDEGDNEVKIIPIRELIQDNIKRQIIVDAYDRHGVGEGDDPAEEIRKLQAANTEIKAKLLELGDSSIASRDQALALEDRQRQRALGDAETAFGRQKELAGIQHENALDLSDRNHQHALALADKNNEAALGVARARSAGNDSELVAKEAWKRYNTYREMLVKAESGEAITTTDPYTGEPVTRQLSYQEIGKLKQAAEEELQLLQSLGQISRPPAAGSVGVPQGQGQQQSQAPAGLPEGAVLGKPIHKNGQMIYPVLDGKTGKPIINQATGKPMGYVHS